MCLIQTARCKWTPILLLLLLVCVRTKAANLTGTTVSGFADATNGANYFDPSDFINGEKDGSGTTAVIGARHPTFSGGYHDYNVSADFTADSMTVSDVEFAVAAPGTSIAAMMFQDPAFAGLTLEVTGFTGFQSASQFSFALSGETISFVSPALQPEGTFTATVEFLSTPEPSTLTFLLLAFVAVFTTSLLTRRLSQCASIR